MMSENTELYDINYNQIMYRGGSFLVIPFSKGNVFSREDFSEDQKMFVSAAAEFATKRIEPVHKDLNVLNKDLSCEIFREMGELGFCGIDIPEKFGSTHRMWRIGNNKINNRIKAAFTSKTLAKFVST